MMSTTRSPVLSLDGTSVPDRDLVGGKAWSLAQMLSLGLRVPPAVVIPVPECRHYLEAERSLDEEVQSAIRSGIKDLERRTGRRFGDPSHPMLVSVRSGAAVSMPGMMDTILNLGMTDAIEESLATSSGDPAYARDTRARFCHAFGEIVLKADLDPYVTGPTPTEICERVQEDTGRSIPADPYEQLFDAICAVFDSWQSTRAKSYRRHWGIPDDGGTAVTVQAMVFGNLDDRSGTGVLFTRNPLSGAPEPYGEWLPGGQGEDVVGGTHAVVGLAQMREHLPEAVSELLDWADTLEKEHAEVQDIEFTVESGTLYLLQTRAAKRSPEAAVRIAVDLFDEGLIDHDEGLARVTPEQVRSVLMPRLDPAVAAAASVLAAGEPACPGVATGVGVLDPDEAVSRSAAGENVVLVRPTTSPDDVHGMIAAKAVVTDLGGATSHAAVVTRALGRPSVVGVGKGTAASLVGRHLTVDGRSGRVYDTILDLVEARVEDDPILGRIAAWAAGSSPLNVVDHPVEGVEVADLDLLLTDLSARETPIDVDQITAALEGFSSARGAILATEQGVRAAHDTGITVVADCPLLVQLTALRTLGTPGA
ncbi:pyruvate, phosphate dikinase [Aeromicrobium wangtongii]|uniref:Pyruvate, phosphate dikinase n=1 Tax=Aeromicrobium wangtongii TaxID=2969247 RepID=A0ABY5MAM4_9ACTN|nr:pyruvate, phosphate dikinase [Aeromicrobium wangtongii]MCD9197696.1 pyruvate, phosphate dikinase [Aeromicrobium wangtongii]UUP15180.1 pyruvate, phosphate dikinase [Aeromicrobium wangtongii]